MARSRRGPSAALLVTAYIGCVATCFVGGMFLLAVPDPRALLGLVGVIALMIAAFITAMVRA
jgi:hypothetical protein